MKNIVTIFYSVTLFLFTAFSYIFIDPNFFYFHTLYTGFYALQRITTTLFYLFLILILFGIYWFFLNLARYKKLSMTDIKILLLITVLNLLLSYPAMLSFDIFNYTTTAKVLYHYHENPYIIMPIEFSNDPFLHYTRAANKTALYGPIWLMASGIPYMAGFENYLLILLNFKVIALFFYLATIWVIWKLSKSVLAVTFFAFNPLVIIESLVSGHNDVVMMFLALFSLYLLLQKRIVLSAGTLLLSVLIKYSTFFLLPVYIFVYLQTKKHKKLHHEKIYFYLAILMLVIFFLSPIREELYSWYAIWFLSFMSLIYGKNFLSYLALALSFGLMLGYIPYMLFGIYLPKTTLLKYILIFLPVCYTFIYYFFQTKFHLRSTKLI